MALLDFTPSPGVIKNPRWGVGAATFDPRQTAVSTVPAKTTAAAAPAPKAASSADFSVLRNVKNPALEQEQLGLLSDFKKTKEQNTTLFQKYLDEAKSEALRARADLEKERAAYDNTKFREDLVKARADQEAALAASKQNALDFAAGNIERRLLGSTLPTGMSSQLQQQAVDEFSRAVLPFEERLAAGRRDDLGLLRDLDLRTAPLARRAGSEYLSTLLTPLQAGTSLLNSSLGTLGALGDIDRANTFYGLTSPYDHSRVPALPIPSPGYRVPAVPGYVPPRSTYTPLPATAQQFRFSPSQSGARDTAQPLLQSLSAQSYPPDAGEDAALRGTQQADRVEEGRLRASEQQGARAAADRAYQSQTGVNPNSDPYYNDEVWRRFYNDALAGLI